MENKIISEENAFAHFLHKPIQESKFNLSKSSLIECIDKKIEIRSRTSPRFGKTMFSLIKTINNIQEQHSCTIYPIQVNEEFWSFFIPYLLEERSLSVNSARTVVSQLKAVVEWSSHYGAPIDPTFNICKSPSDNGRKIALTPDDISRIYHYNYDGIKRRKQHINELKRVKDMFCLMCNTGLRFSDAKRISKEHFKEGVIDILQQKTGQYAHIDTNYLSIHKDMLMEILKRYNYNAPYTKDLSNFDKFLHEIMELCGFNDKLHREYVQNGEVKKTDLLKKELITSHTGRRTFVVNNILRGVPHLSVMRATGHKTYSAFEKYLCY